MSGFVSNFNLPLYFLDRINELCAPHGFGLSDYIGEPGGAIATCVAELCRREKPLESGGVVWTDYQGLEDIRKRYGENAVSHFRAGTNPEWRVASLNPPEWDAHRRIDELTCADISVICNCLKMSYSGKYVMLRYNDIGLYTNPAITPLSDAFTAYEGLFAECRSVVIDLEKMDIASLPFYKFRNLGECAGYMMEDVAERIANAQRIEFTDKMDGTFVQMRYIGGTEVADGVLITTSGSMSSNYLPFIREWIEDHPECRYLDMCRDYPCFTFMFELIAPEFEKTNNFTHIVEYPKDLWGIYLTGIRDIETGELAYHDQVSGFSDAYDVPTTIFFKDFTLAEALDICASASPTDREGFVLNADGFLVKIKLNDFCQVSHLIHEASFNSIIRSVVDGSMDDYLAKVPVSKQQPLIDMRNELLQFDLELDEIIEWSVSEMKKFGSKKDAVAWVQSALPSRWTAFAIAAYDGKAQSTYLAKRLGTKSPQYLKEDDFREQQRLLEEFAIRERR